jgi:hypothetical protein
MPPKTLFARGLAASAAGLPGAPRWVLWVSVTYTSPLSGCTRSIRAVHLRGTNDVAGQARMDQHLGLVREAAGRIDTVAPMSGGHWPRPSAS